MSDIFRKSMQPKKRTFGDWLFDNFGWVVGGVMLVAALVTGTAVYLIASNIHEVAREVGGIARSAADGYSSAAKK